MNDENCTHTHKTCKQISKSITVNNKRILLQYQLHAHTMSIRKVKKSVVFLLKIQFHDDVCVCVEEENLDLITHI